MIELQLGSGHNDLKLLHKGANSGLQCYLSTSIDCLDECNNGSSLSSNQWSKQPGNGDSKLYWPLTDKGNHLLELYPIS